MATINRPHSDHKKKKRDHEVAEQIAEKRQKRREEKQALKLLQKKNKRRRTPIQPA